MLKTILILTLIFSSCSRLKNLGTKNVDDKQAMYQFSSKVCAEEEKEFFFEGSEQEIELFQKMKKSFIRLKKIDHIVLFNLFQLYINPIISFQNSSFQILYFLKGSPKLLEVTSVSKNGYSSFKALDILLRENKSNYSLLDFIKITDRNIPSYLPISKKLEKLILNNKNNSFVKLNFYKNAIPYKHKELFKTLKLKPRILSYLKEKKSIDFSINKNLLPLRKNLDCSLSEGSLIQKSNTLKSSSYGARFNKSFKFIAHLRNQVETNDLAKLCILNKGLLLASLDNLSNEEILTGLASNSSKDLYQGRSVTLTKPGRLLIESNLLSSKVMNNFRSKGKPLYHKDRIGKTWIENERQVFLDPRYEDTRLCK